MESAFDWSPIRLVVFDMDGTLYDQAPVRRAMAGALLGHALTRLDLRTLRVVARYRREKEALADAETPDFEPVLIARVAAATGTTPADVAATVADWIETRPLPHLAAARTPGIAALFGRLRASGRTIAILSDYPAAAKLATLDLAAEWVIAAGDPEVGIMKPHPRGLQHAMALAGATAAQTLLIGDRIDRDGEAARRAGTAALVRSRVPRPGWRCFADFDDPLFRDIPPSSPA